MSTILDFISNNGLVSALIAAAVSAIIGGAWKWRRDHEDSQVIYNFLLTSETRTIFSFRSTEAISSHTKLPEERVADLCSKHPKIRRSEKEKQSWALVE